MNSSENVLTRGERTRQAILEAAEQLFKAQGYNGSSMRQIAHQAGNIALSGIYNHFASKEDIFRALLEARSPYPELIGILTGIQNGTSAEMLAQAFREIQILVIDHMSFVQLVLIDMQEFEGKTITSLASEMLPYAFQFFTRVQAAGGIREDIPFPVLIRSFIGTTAGFILTSIFLNQGLAEHIPVFSSVPPEMWQAAVLDVLMNGLAKQGQNQ